MAGNLDTIQRTTANWLERVVIGLNLCPFAGREWQAGRVRTVVSTAAQVDVLLDQLEHELSLLQDNADIETTLLVHPWVLQDFGDYNNFLDTAEALLTNLGLDGEIQLASFHPDYRFAETAPADAENYTNRAPYPMLHLLREASVARAVASHPDAAGIPEHNIQVMRKLGAAAMQALLTDLQRNDP